MYLVHTYTIKAQFVCWWSCRLTTTYIEAALEKKGKVIDGLLLLPRHIYLRNVQYLICMHGACRSQIDNRGRPFIKDVGNAMERGQKLIKIWQWNTAYIEGERVYVNKCWRILWMVPSVLSIWSKHKIFISWNHCAYIIYCTKLTLTCNCHIGVKAFLKSYFNPRISHETLVL